MEAARGEWKRREGSGKRRARGWQQQREVVATGGGSDERRGLIFTSGLQGD